MALLILLAVMVVTLNYTVFLMVFRLVDVGEEVGKETMTIRLVLPQNLEEVVEGAVAPVVTVLMPITVVHPSMLLEVAEEEVAVAEIVLLV